MQRLITCDSLHQWECIEFSLVTQPVGFCAFGSRPNKINLNAVACDFKLHEMVSYSKL